MLRVLVGLAIVCVGCGGSGGTLTGAGGNAGNGSGGFTGSLGGIIGGGPNTGVSNFNGTNNCGEPKPAQPKPPDIMIVLDASSSMNDDMTNMTCAGGCGQRSKWADAVASINTVVADTALAVNWGLELFATEGVSACGTWTGVHVDAVPDAAPAIATVLQNQSTPDGGVYSAGTRQTRGAMSAARAYLDGLAFNAKFIVLMTDGVPVCAPDGISVADDTKATVETIAAAGRTGTPTLVVGLATADGAAHASMVMMADAGLIGGNGNTLDGISQEARTRADIATALRTMVAATTGCTFHVPQGSPDGTMNSSHIGVSLGGVEIPRDVNNGWDYTDSTSAVELHGTACAAARGPDAPQVSIHFKCILI